MLQDDFSAALPDLFARWEGMGAGLPVLDAEAVVARMDALTADWHTPRTTEPEGWVACLHRANFDLWHLEDSARDPHATPQDIARVKRAIDTTNQGRNDCVERIDTDLLALLTPHGLPAAESTLHSETPGQMLDRLSILALKRFHMAEEAVRPSAGAAHRSTSRARLDVLQAQSEDLAGCLHALWSEVTAGRRRFKLYRQMKMYNDAELNPVLYRRPTV